MSSSKRKILLVGQTPPPYGGQAIMIEKIVHGKYSKIEIFHVRMAFSKEMNEMGKMKISKFLHLPYLILKIIYFKYKFGISTLYYPPAGPQKSPLIRDFLILIFVRPFFRSVIFHFHAGGISEMYPDLNWFFKILFRMAFFKTELGIRLSQSSPDDSGKLKAKHSVIVPYGIADKYKELNSLKVPSTTCTLLFVGMLSESKGLNIFIESCILLKSRGVNFLANVMGKFESPEFEKMIREKITKHGLESVISFLGVRTGDEKFKVYLNSDIFCFPSFFEAESFPVVLLEASSFALPIVSTHWRGIPSIVQDTVTGYLTPTKDPSAVADKLELLIKNPELRASIGGNARKTYLEKWVESKFYENIENALSLNSISNN